MGFQIEDGGGTGVIARINTDKQLLTKAVVTGECEFASLTRGRAFSWASGTYDPAVGDTILLVKNISTTQALHIDVVILSTDTDTRVIIHLPTTEVTPTGTAITGVNFNASSANVAEATAIRDETNNTQGGIILSGEIMATGQPLAVNFDGAVILGTNDSIGVDFVGDVAACDVTIIGHFQ